MKLHLPPSNRNQTGITSIVVVFVLVVLLTLLGVGFTKIMNRSLQSSSAAQQASAASYAAQSGINDAISYVKKSLAANPDADVSASQCGKLIDPGGPLEAAAKLSSDGSTAYTCVLVDPNPTSLFYQNLSPYKSQVIKITTAAPLTSLLFSWQASNRTQNQFVPTADGTVLYDEKTWSDKNYAPLLRVTLYPIPASGDLTNVQANTKTFFLYPQSSGGNNVAAYTSPSGFLAVDCSSKALGSFSGSADYDCNLVIHNLASAGASYFYVRLTPFYAQSVVKVKGNGGANQALQFKNVQSVIDVTAKSGSAVKRLQARMDSGTSGSGTDLNISSGSDSAPEFALQTTSTLCKRLVVPPAVASPVVIDPGSVLNCGLTIVPPPKPDVTTGDASDIKTNSATLNGTVNPNGYNVTTCKFDYGTTQSYGSSVNCASLPGAGKGNVAVRANIGSLAAGTTYHFQLVAANANGQNEGGDKTFTTNSPPPIPPSVGKFNYHGLSGSSLNFSYSCNNSSSASITVNPNRTGGGEGTQPLGDISGTSNVGGPYQTGDKGTARLNCSSNVGTASRSLDWSVDYPKIEVKIIDATGWWPDPKVKTPQACKAQDRNTHYWLICVSWTSKMSDNSGIYPCYIFWRGDDNSASSGGPHSQNGNNIPLGFTVQAGGKSGWIYVGCTSQKYPNIAVTTDPPIRFDKSGICGISPNLPCPEPTPPPTPPPQPTPPSPPAPIPPTPCAFDNRRLFYPTFGFIRLPTLYFGRVCSD